MKKKYFFTIYFLTTAICYGYSQENPSKLSHGLQYSIFAAGTIDYGFTSNISYTFDRDKFSFSIGPSFGKTAKYDIYGGEPKNGTFNIIGGLSSFRYSVTSPEKPVTLFFIYDLYFHYYKGQDTYYPRNAVEPYEISVVDWKAGFCIGNGVSFRIRSQFYISANVGIGYKIEDYIVNTDNDFYPNISDESGFNLIIKSTLKYTFKNKDANTD